MYELVATTGNSGTMFLGGCGVGGGGWEASVLLEGKSGWVDVGAEVAGDGTSKSPCTHRMLVVRMLPVRLMTYRYTAGEGG